MERKNGDGKKTSAWDDALLLEGQLYPDEQMVRDSARRYALDTLMPRILTANRPTGKSGSTPRS